ncbi:MAG TPA: hypothetical protein VFM05_03380 [Candidatus Saccharimonadales bacterium]|nr:hypothetical protein [Candidatus Saccharimonadales bacterium]
MEFFIPAAKDAEQEQHVYDGIKKFLSEELGAVFSNRKVFSLTYVHEGKDYYAEVGKPHALNGETVVAILYEPARGLYHVCTLSRGVARGMSILVGLNDVRSATDFD